jgi:hypothetical protein
VVEGARLERVYRGNSIEGSNPSLSAIFSFTTIHQWPPKSANLYGKSARIRLLLFVANRPQPRYYVGNGVGIFPSVGKGRPKVWGSGHGKADGERS